MPMNQRARARSALRQIVRCLACIASRPPAAIKGEKLDKLIISHLNGAVNGSRISMATKEPPKSKEFITDSEDSEDSELSDDGGVMINFSENITELEESDKTGLEESDKTAPSELAEKGTKSPSPTKDSNSLISKTTDSNVKSIKDPKKDPPDPEDLNLEVPDSGRKYELVNTLANIKTGGSETEIRTKQPKTSVITKGTAEDSLFKSPQPVVKQRDTNKLNLPSLDSGGMTEQTVLTVYSSKVPDSSDSTTSTVELVPLPVSTASNVTAKTATPVCSDFTQGPDSGTLLQNKT